MILLARKQSHLLILIFMVMMAILIIPSPAKPIPKAPSHHGHLKAVGPGEAPHYLSIDRNKLLKVKSVAKSPQEIPSPVHRTSAKTVRVKLQAQELVSTLADQTEYIFWTYSNTVPGPMLRARVGDTIVLTLSNHPDNSHQHSIDLHAVTGPGGGASLTRVEPGESKTISFKALRAGLFVYHCASGNVPTHIANGLYGMILIEPKEGLSTVEREFYVMQGEVYTEGPVGETGFQKFSPKKMMDEKPEYIVLNGRVKSLTKDNALHARKGETIRIFFGNAGVSKISSFNLIGEIFDRVYPEASLKTPLYSVQTTLVPAGGATVVELKLENSGTYILLDHAIARIDRGAYGLLHVSGEAELPLLQSIQP